MTIGEQRHMAIVEAQLRRIADALEKIAERICNNNNKAESEVTP